MCLRDCPRSEERTLVEAGGERMDITGFGNASPDIPIVRSGPLEPRVRLAGFVGLRADAANN